MVSSRKISVEIEYSAVAWAMRRPKAKSETRSIAESSTHWHNKKTRVSEPTALVAGFGNFFEGDIYAGRNRLLPYAKSICTKSWNFDEQGNETKIDFGRMMSLIKESSFRGCIAIEHLG